VFSHSACGVGLSELRVLNIQKLHKMPEGRSQKKQQKRWGDIDGPMSYDTEERPRNRDLFRYDNIIPWDALL